MIKSMTGYSRKERVIRNHRVIVEIRSVNHRFCEIVTHLPTIFAPHEAKIKRVVSERVARGKVDLSISLKSGSKQQEIIIDKKMARQYVHILKKLQRELALGGTIDINLLANIRELTTFFPAPIPSSVVSEIINQALPPTLDEFDYMRQQEGRALVKDITGHIRQIRKDINVIKRRIPHIVKRYNNRLREKIKQLTQHPISDDVRISQEIALFATRSDINEELSRTISHLDQCQTLLKEGTEVGKPLNFLVQELNREINTMGAKANDLDVSHRTVTIKSALEKIREQLQNLE